jgi:hypothetical protein
MARAWADHAHTPEAVAQRLRTETPAPTAPAHIGALARLVVHLLGEHLGRFDDAHWRLSTLEGHPLASDAAAASELRVGHAALSLAQGRDQGAAASTLAETLRALGAAAALCVGRGQCEHAMALLADARLRLADLPEATSADHRPLAVACNNIAWTLHDLGAARSAAETAAMLDIAAASRAHWSHAGTWLEVERADYCLALTHLSAGRPDDALRHAAQCLAACIGHDAPPFEHFYGHEAIARVQQARGDQSARDHHVGAAQAAFERLGSDDQAACRDTLDSLRALGAAA